MKALIQTVVVAVSGSEASVSAAKYGILMARLYRLRLVGVYVVDTATLRELLLSKIFVEDESSEYEKSLEENGRRYLNYVEGLAAEERACRWRRSCAAAPFPRRSLRQRRRRAPTSSFLAASRRARASATC